jgi:molybdate transport system permease protein
MELSADETGAVRLSLRVAFWAMLGSLPFGLVTAVVLARGRFCGKSLLDGVVHLPLVMPPVVTGYLLLLLFRTLVSIALSLVALLAADLLAQRLGRRLSAN